MNKLDGIYSRDQNVRLWDAAPSFSMLLFRSQNVGYNIDIVVMGWVFYSGPQYFKGFSIEEIELGSIPELILGGRSFEADERAWRLAGSEAGGIAYLVAQSVSIYRNQLQWCSSPLPLVIHGIGANPLGERLYP